jgi:hypothetical protein
MNEANDVAVVAAVIGWHSILESKATSGPNFDHSGVDDAIDAIFSWVTDSSTQSLIMWVHDDDRTKTSFIAQVVAYLLAERGQLSATYFFDSQTDRNSFVPTLVHDFAMQHERNSALLNEISRVIESNPVGVFNLIPRVQLNRLLVGPLEFVSKSCEDDPHHHPQDDIILLHALEECNDDGGFQESLLSALLDALLYIKENTVFPQRLLVIGKRTNRLEECLMGKLASRLPILQRPVQSQHLLTREQDILQKAIELTKREEELQRSFQDREDKMRQERRRHEEECESIKKLYLQKTQEVDEREEMVQKRENQLREREELLDQKERASKKKRQEQGGRLTSRTKENETREGEISRSASSMQAESEDIRLPSSKSSTSLKSYRSPSLQTPIEELWKQEDARMLYPASQVTKSDRVIMYV